MKFYTVLYTCNRDYPCFRTIQARNEVHARQVCVDITYNLKSVDEVRDYVGQQ